jgi:hypothetical protein
VGATAAYSARLISLAESRAALALRGTEIDQSHKLRLIGEYFAYGVTLTIFQAFNSLDQDDADRFAEEMFDVAGEVLGSAGEKLVGEPSTPENDLALENWIRGRAADYETDMARVFIPAEAFVPVAMRTGCFKGRGSLGVELSLLGFPDKAEVIDHIGQWKTERAGQA